VLYFEDEGFCEKVPLISFMTLGETKYKVQTYISPPKTVLSTKTVMSFCDSLLAQYRTTTIARTIIAEDKRGGMN